MRWLLFRPPYISPAIYCAAHHGNNLYLRRDAVSFQAFGELVNVLVILTKGLMPLPFTQHRQRQARKLATAFFFWDETQDGICQSLSQQISGRCQLALPLALRLFNKRQLKCRRHRQHTHAHEMTDVLIILLFHFSREGEEGIMHTCIVMTHEYIARIDWPQLSHLCC
jgi:hypothetical protein